MYIAVDFDGTIVDHAYPDIGKPVPHALDWLTIWQAYGAKIILFTMRDNRLIAGNTLGQAMDYLRKAGIEPHGANWNPEQDSWTSSNKVYANIYVDDAAFGCPLIKIDGFNRKCVDWSIVGPQIEDKLLANLGDLSYNRV